MQTLGIGIGRLFVAIFVLIAALFGAARAAERFYMMPYEQKEAIADLIASIGSAHSNIDIAIYSFTNKEIAKALREASIRGVRVNIIYDSSQKKSETSTISYLEKFENIKTCLLEGRPSKNKKYNGLMHQKLIIVDDSLIGLGSANWSKNAFENNYETLYFTDSMEVIQKAKGYYKDMLSKCKPYMAY